MAVGSDSRTAVTGVENGALANESMVMVELSTKVRVRNRTVGGIQGREVGPGNEPSNANGSTYNENSPISNENNSVSDESISFWAPQGSPGLYQICWNPQIAPNNDPSAYSEYLGVIEVLPVLSIVGEPSPY